MKNYNNRNDFLFFGLTKLFVFYFLFLLLMLVFRLGFVLYFGDLTHLENYQEDLYHAFFIGWKYDTLVLSYLLAPLYLLLIPVSLLKNSFVFEVYQFIQRSFFILFGILIPVILLLDLAFFSFFQDRINILFFGVLEDDTQALIESIWKSYPVEYPLLGFLIYVIFLFKGSKYFFPKMGKNKSYLHSGFLKYIFMLSLSFLLLVGGLRGGYGQLVIAPKYSDFSESEFINLVANNGVVALEKAFKLRSVSNQKNFSMTSAMGYKDNIHEAFSDFLGLDVSPTQKDQLINLIKRRTSENMKLEDKKYNVVVLLMESFGSSWLKYNSPEFDFLGELDTHFKKDYYFKNFVSSDNGTIGSLLSLATSIPSRPGKRFLSESKFMQLPLSSSAHIAFQKNGYESSFIYGGKLGWRDIGKYFKYQNFENIIGENGIKKKLEIKDNLGTEWGLYDEHFFDYIENHLKESSRPQFILGLSTTNHPPFQTPKGFKAPALQIPLQLKVKITREENLFLERFKAFQYSNMALAQFISRIKNSSLGEDTIIVVTGDHNFWGFMNYEKTQAYSKYLVPLYMYIPEDIKVENFDPHRVGSHEDIMGTLYNIALSNTEYLSFGEDLFSAESSYAINSSIRASHRGVVYKNSSYEWDKLPYIKKVKSKKELNELDKRYRSSMAISDYFLEEEFRKAQELSKLQK